MRIGDGAAIGEDRFVAPGSSAMNLPPSRPSEEILAVRSSGSLIVGSMAKVRIASKVLLSSAWLVTEPILMPDIRTSEPILIPSTFLNLAVRW